jgi:hypothetical protein
MSSAMFTPSFIAETMQHYDGLIRQALHDGDVVIVMNANEVAIVSHYTFATRVCPMQFKLFFSEKFLSDLQEFYRASAGSF